MTAPNEESDVCGRSKAPPGWWCSRSAGHEGPCAAWPSPLHAAFISRTERAQRAELALSRFCGLDEPQCLRQPLGSSQLCEGEDLCDACRVYQVIQRLIGQAFHGLRRARRWKAVARRQFHARQRRDELLTEALALVDQGGDEGNPALRKFRTRWLAEVRATRAGVGAAKDET